MISISAFRMWRYEAVYCVVCTLRWNIHTLLWFFFLFSNSYDSIRIEASQCFAYLLKVIDASTAHFRTMHVSFHEIKHQSCMLMFDKFLSWNQSLMCQSILPNQPMFLRFLPIFFSNPVLHSLVPNYALFLGKNSINTLIPVQLVWVVPGLTEFANYVLNQMVWFYQKYTSLVGYWIGHEFHVLSQLLK